MTKKEVDIELERLDKIINEENQELKLKFLYEENIEYYDEGVMLIDDIVHYDFWLSIAHILNNLKEDVFLQVDNGELERQLCFKILERENAVHSYLTKYSKGRNRRQIMSDIKFGYTMHFDSFLNGTSDMSKLEWIFKRALKKGIISTEWDTVKAVLKSEDYTSFINWHLYGYDLFFFMNFLFDEGFILEKSKQKRARIASTIFKIDGKRISNSESLRTQKTLNDVHEFSKKIRKLVKKFKKL